VHPLRLVGRRAAVVELQPDCNVRAMGSKRVYDTAPMERIDADV